jgi:hypothetical protein
MKRFCLHALAGAVVLFTLFAPTASAALPCAPVEAHGSTYRVATVRVSCDEGRDVVATFYARWDSGDIGPRLHVQGFACSPTLAASELSCSSGNRWIYASARPEDHPSTWHPDPPFLGADLAGRLMRKDLLRRPVLAFSAGYGRRVRCTKRVSRIRLRCRMSWVVGDSVLWGRGMIWLVFRGDRTGWNSAYRITRLDEYCAYVAKGGHCTRTYVAH